ncbi:MAG: hypothetical protein J3R72DRAFT_521127 [Linnemannia gamsii]|nr:MAG: hypothetical protein J3R72DRAFT_521127 [Linnemannia gamsii]
MLYDDAEALQGERRFGHPNSTLSNDDILLYLQKLIRTLLLSLPKEDQVTDLLRAAYLPPHEMQNRQLSTGPISIPYYTFLTKVDDDNVWKEFEYVQAPLLQTISFAGSWSLDSKRVMRVLFAKVAPKIKDISMPSSIGLFDLAEWAKGDRSL